MCFPSYKLVSPPFFVRYSAASTETFSRISVTPLTVPVRAQLRLATPGSRGALC